ncbi:transcription antitermination factor NusB [Candidatus Bandiella numerosa]|uniref:transcription antitermination factor NusB n=1 Tax=Candidatus Bandiella numerosa TaxID=2570586 RepID=UPI001F0281A7|nr:transcription antitermination factor NusB [Candidatus Bandiella numerosa]
MIKDIQNLTDNSEYLSLYPARILVVQTLYSIDILNKKKDIEQISLDYIEYHVEKYSNQNLDEKFYYELLSSTIDNTSSIDELIRTNLNKKWRLERLPKLVLAILRVGIADISIMNHLEVATIINDYLQITKSLNHSEELGFINSILDKIAKDLKRDVELSICNIL